MKVILRHVLYKTQCQFCGTEFAFEKSDTLNRPTADNKKILPFTECPNCDFLLRVGSVSCYQCAYFVSHDYKRQTVTCKCPENHKLYDFDPKPALIIKQQ